jgi:hypothetical protein
MGWSDQEAFEHRREKRVVFEHGYPARIMGLDGTWQMDVLMEDVSGSGAKLTLFGSVEHVNLNEFFLVLSTWGYAHRRCELAWVNGDQIGVQFLKASQPKTRRRREPREEH